MGLDNLAKILSDQQLHADIGRITDFTQIVDRNDVWVLETRTRTGLPVEPLPNFGIYGLAGAHGLERHLPIQHRVSGSIHGAHGTNAQLFKNLILANAGHGTALQIVSYDDAGNIVRSPIDARGGHQTLSLVLYALPRSENGANGGIADDGMQTVARE